MCIRDSLMGCAPGIAEVYLYSKADRAVYGHLFVEVEGRPNVDYVARLIAAAEKELGYREASNGYTKYGFWYGTYQGHHYTNLHLSLIHICKFIQCFLMFLPEVNIFN